MPLGTKRRWLLPLCAAITLTAPAAGASAGGSKACENRDNHSPKKLVECIQTADLWSEMTDLQAIADANPGPDGHASRNSGEPGYRASADYVADAMRAAGYDVTIQPYTFDYFAYQGVPELTNTSDGRTYTLVDEWNPGAGTGTADAQVQPAGGIVDPPDPNGPTSTSGCTAADFSGFTAGNIALVQRGGCNFGEKVLNATAAHAAGVIIFNEGNPGRTGNLSGSMVDADGNPFIAEIPVAFTSWDNGHALATESPAPTVHLDIQAIVDHNRPDYNVIAESKGGDPNRVVVVDAHLDAIYGAGMLDNASGSVTILDIAKKMRKVHPRNKLRFIWFGGEELGLLGSRYYVDNLSPDELGRIGYDLDADVTASPNYSIGVLDPAGPDLFGRTSSTDFPPEVYAPSQASRDILAKYFASTGRNHTTFSPVGTDAFTFNMAGIPAGGVLTGQDCCKTQEEVDLFGGSLGNYEGNVPGTDGGCVDNPFRWCDNLSNNDPEVLTFMSKGFADLVARMAFDDKIMGKPDKGKGRKRKASFKAQMARHQTRGTFRPRGRHRQPAR